MQDLSYLVQAMDEDVFGKRFCKLSQGLAEVQQLRQPIFRLPTFFVLSMCLSCYVSGSFSAKCAAKPLHAPSGLLVQVVGDYGLLSFQPLAIEDKDSVQKVLALVDKASGHAFSALSRSQNPYPAEVAYALGVSDPHEDAASHQDKYMTGEVTERRPGY